MENIIEKSEIIMSDVYIKMFVSSLANEINDAYKDKILTVVPILDASFMFTSDLIKYINVEMEFNFIKVISYHLGIPSDPEIIVNFDPNNIKNKDILIVDTIVDSGNTIREVKKFLRGLSPKSIKTCALVVKNNKNNKDVYVDFPSVVNIDGFLFGYGTDYKDGTCRNLKHMYRLKG